MGILAIWIFLFPLLAGIAAFFVSKATRTRLEAASNSNAKLIGAIAFILSFILIFTAISFLLFYNFQLRR